MTDLISYWVCFFLVGFVFFLLWVCFSYCGLNPHKKIPAIRLSDPGSDDSAESELVWSSILFVNIHGRMLDKTHHLIHFPRSSREERTLGEKAASNGLIAGMTTIRGGTSPRPLHRSCTAEIQYFHIEKHDMPVRYGL